MFVWMLKDGECISEMVHKAQLEAEWDNHTPNQQIYTPHLNRWDLCDDFPKYTEENPVEADPDADDDEEWEEGETVAMQPSKATVPANRYTLEPPPALYVLEPPPASAHRAVSVQPVGVFNSLLNRFGWDIMASSNWDVNVVTTKTYGIIGMVLGFKPQSLQPPIGFDLNKTYVALDSMIKTVIQGPLDNAELPDAFDHGCRKLSIDDAPLKVFVASGPCGPLYVVHPVGRPDAPSWVISTPDAAIVLLIFRRKLYSMEAIARELVECGACFGTVKVSCSIPLYPPSCPTRGLGLRPKDFAITKEDYDEYLRRREHLLKGPRGCAALMHGGIVSRIARDVLDLSVVLIGPSAEAVSVGLASRYAVADEVYQYTLNDDHLSTHEFDIICGVYYVKNCGSTSETTDGGKYIHLSWWPRDYTWKMHNGFNPVEWTELAEEFYQQILTRRQKDITSTLFNTRQWKESIRKQNTKTKKLLANSEAHQAAFLNKCICG